LLPINRFPAIGGHVSGRAFLSMLVAMAIAFAPFAIPMGEASVAAAGHHSDMVKAGHCDDQPAPAKPDNHKDKPCCAAGCMAAAMLPAMGEAMLQLPHANARPGLDLFYRGYLGEIATPPPRLS
jgi:hypothetical protein